MEITGMPTQIITKEMEEHNVKHEMDAKNSKDSEKGSDTIDP